MSMLVLLAVAHAADNRTALFGWGDNVYGVTWPVAWQYRTWAQPLPNLRGTVVAVDQGPYHAYGHAVAARDDGTVLAWGDNSFGQGGFVGGGGWTGDLVAIPHEVAGPRDVTAVAAGGGHDLALTASGEVWAWGANDSGQLGTGSIGGIGAPNVVVGLPLPAVAIAAPGEASAAILTDGTVWTWGGDDDQELGDGSAASASPSATPMPTQALPEAAVAIEGGESHFVVLLADGTAASWGGNWHGELGRVGIPTSVNAWSAVPDRISDWWGGAVKDVSDIDVGPQNTLLSTANGSVLGCGSNDAGQLPSVSGTVPVSIPIPLFALTGSLDVEMGGAGGMALDAAGDLVAWGACGYGMCGTGTGLTDPAHVVTTPERVLHLDDAAILSAGPVSFLVVAPSPGTDVWGTGGNGFGQIGDGTTSDYGKPVSIGFGRAVGIAGGLDHTLALLDDGSVWSWGHNRIGQLGDGTTFDSTRPVKVQLDQVKQVAVGNELSVALRHDGTVWVWGSNWDGAFGDGTRAGDSPIPVQVPDLRDVVAIAAGQYHVLALQSDGTVLAWGHVESAELGYWGASFWVSKPTPVVFEDDDAVGISAGWGHSMVLTSKGEVFTFGANDAGQLGTGSVDPSGAPPHPPEQVKIVDPDTGESLAATDLAAGGWLSMATVWDYSVYRWGDDIRTKRWVECVPDGGLGDPLPVPLGVPAPVLDLAGGTCHGLALTTEHTVWGYGSGKGGALGDGSWADSITPVQMALDAVNVIGPAGGHSEVLVSGGE
ncbi:MAG: hypothetical protein ABMA64_22055, partial [Myxococcota bacterium]